MEALFVSWLLLLAGAVLALACGRNRRFADIIGCGGAISGCCLGLYTAISSLFTTIAVTAAVAWPLPGEDLALTLDPLAAFFLTPVFLLGLVCAIYGSEYMAASNNRLPGMHWFFYNLLLFFMALTVTAGHGLVFLFAWEGMALTSFFLVIADHRRQEVRRAGFIYLAATHLGAAVLFGVFLSASMFTGSLAFSSFSMLHNLSQPMAALFFLAALLGFGSKAGLVLLHVWLPEAHPAAPSHVSAIMSAVMVKTAIYGFLRFLFFLPQAPAWWGVLLMVTGISGALFGIAMAALQRDIKQSLAYSTVENIGIILFALGTWLYATALDQRAAAALALVGALLHVWNHALFKGLLFLGAGSLVHGAGTRDLDRMGGLLRRMPVTGVAFIGAGMAVTALPPANGLVGEFYIYLSLLLAGSGLPEVAAFFPLVLLGVFALIGGMAILVFTRFIGIGLCGEPRSAAAAAAHESGWRMQSAMGLLFLLCLAGGLVPALLLSPVTRVLTFLEPTLVGPLSSVNISPAWIGQAGALVLALVLFVALVLKRFGSRSQGVGAPTWGCGFPFPTSRMAYSAAGYSELATNSLMSGFLRPVAAGGRSVTFFPGPARLTLLAEDPFLNRFCEPLFHKFALSCKRLRLLQSGSLYIYMLYIFVATGLLLVWVGFGGR